MNKKFDRRKKRKYNRPDYTVQESKVFLPEKSVGSQASWSDERATTLAAGREIRKERDTRNSVVTGRISTDDHGWVGKIEKKRQKRGPSGGREEDDE
jgi:hypothetical protein